ncbi:YD repeat-containing protein [Gilliamella bombicola]|uniref:YD repeat-containing protein n=2 Tax=Gilliamella bombicola TaxID=1798182 RepID=A0A1C4AKB9_9GAMM|nr:YD repeat-containing protein [Gilliamella bombicola]
MLQSKMDYFLKDLSEIKVIGKGLSKTMKKYFNVVPLTLLVMLSGCDKSKVKLTEEIKATLEDQDKPICFYLGKVTFPYLKKDLSYPANERSEVWINNELNRRLEVFTSLGLLDRSLDANNQTTTYQLAKLNSDTKFKKGSFCFGQVTLDKLFFLGMSNNVNSFATVTYNIEQIPSWVNNDIFKQYFYAGELDENKKDAHFAYSYPKLIDGQFPNQISSDIKLAKLVNGEFIFDNDDSIRQSFFYSEDENKWDQEHFTYAYYDKEKVAKIRKYFFSYNRIINDWGIESDPVLFAKANPSENLARSTNQVVMYYFFDHALTQNRIKSATGNIKNKLLGQYQHLLDNGGSSVFEMNFDDSGLVTSFVETTKSYNYVLKRSIVASDDLETERTSWKFYDYFTMSLPSINQNYTNPFATDNYNKTDLFDIFQTDYRTKFVQKMGELDKLRSVSVGYDDEDKILFFDKNMTFQYNNKNQLISRVIGNETYTMEYNKQGQLTKLKKYVDNNKKATLECQFSKHNEKGDWIVKECDDHMITTRTIEYY